MGTSCYNCIKQEYPFHSAAVQAVCDYCVGSVAMLLVDALGRILEAHVMEGGWNLS